MGNRVGLVYSNRTEALLERLAVAVARHRRAADLDPLEPAHLVVPNANVGAWVKLGLARHLGIAAGVAVHQLRRLSLRWAEAALPSARVFDHDTLLAGLLGALADDALLAEPAFAPARRYVTAAGERGPAADRRRFQLATALARIFEEYTYSRADMVARWPDGLTLDEEPWRELEGWQRALYLRLFGEGGRLSVRAAARGFLRPVPLFEAVRRGRPAADPFPGGVFFFGFSYVAPVYHELFRALAATSAVHLFVLSPCRTFWEDVQKRDAADNAALARWGLPGAENARQLTALTEGDHEEAYVAHGEAATLLARLQDDVLDRRSAREVRELSRGPLPAGDGSVRVLACPGVRREVEIVASEIWATLADAEARGAPMRLSDVAVIVTPSQRDAYVAQLQAVFAESHGLPFALVDVPFAGESRAAQAVGLLLELPLSPFTREDVLRVVTHPAVAEGFGAGDDAAAWARLAAAVGIFRGADGEDLAGTYVTGDVFHWDQGLTRISLGTVMVGERSFDETAATAGQRDLLPEETAGDGAAQAASFVLLVRSLLADARHARALVASLPTWSAFFVDYAATYVRPASEGEQRALALCLDALREVGDLDLGDVEVSYTVASEVAKSRLAALEGHRGGAGVVVSSLLPMRSLPFRAVFLMGMGEGAFPAADRPSPLDLRGAQPHRWDVRPRDGDRYLFLETLLCARDRLVVSYVAKDETTGERLEPSSVVTELFDLLDAAYFPAAGAARAALTAEHPLRRFDGAYDAAPAAGPPLTAPAQPGAAAERAARALRAHWAEHTRSTPARVDPWQAHDALSPPSRSPFASLLCLAPREAPPAVAEEGSVTMALRALWSLLDDPLQAYARFRLGLEDGEDDDEDIAAVREEPLALSPLDRTVLAREAVTAALEGRAAADAGVGGALARLEARGRAPTGVVLAPARRDLEERFVTLERTVRGALGVPSGALPLASWRLGRAAEVERSVRHAPALELSVRVPVAGGPGAPGRAVPRRVSVHGLAQPVAAERCHLLIVNRKPSGAEMRGRALRIFVERCALVAAAVVPEGPFEAMFFALKEPTFQGTVAFGALDVERARAQLERIVVDLLAAPHDYFFPADVALDVAAGARAGWAAAAAARLEKARRAPRGAGRSPARGPIAAPETYPSPAASAIEAILDRRFALFTELVRP